MNIEIATVTITRNAGRKPAVDYTKTIQGLPVQTGNSLTAYAKGTRSEALSMLNQAKSMNKGKPESEVIHLATYTLAKGENGAEDTVAVYRVAAPVRKAKDVPAQGTPAPAAS